ncbi:MAG: 50S ribosomal protein L11 methyltransferase [Paracoccaceae bacterium]|jgi:ribosomal protein L11 methyltransferase
MPTYSALTTVSGQDPAEALAEALELLAPEPTGVGVFEVEDGLGLWEIGAYFMDQPDLITLDVLALAFGAKAFAVSEVPEIDWVAKVKRELSPVEAGRFFVYGSHDADRVPAGRVALLIEAAVAFGTGHHGTTLGCLCALDRLLDAGFRPLNVADIGCGTAVLAMAVASVCPDALIFASDIDMVAVEVALANAEANNLKGRIACVQAVGFDHMRLAQASPFDLVFANILKGPLIQLAPDMAVHISLDGLAILSGLLVVQAETITVVYEKAGFSLQGREDIGEWSTLVFKRV